MTARAFTGRCALALALLVAGAGARAQELVDRWFGDCAAVAARSGAAKAWLQERGPAQAPRGCFLWNGGELLFLQPRTMAGGLPGVHYIDLRRHGATPVRIGGGDDEVIAEAGAVNGKHYVLLRTLALPGGVEQAGHSLLYLVPRRGAQPPLRLVSLHSSAATPCQDAKTCHGDHVRHVFSDGAADRLELTLPGPDALVAEPRPVLEAGKVTGIEFPTTFGGAPLRYRISQGSMDFSVEDLAGFAERVKRRFPAATARTLQPS